MLEDNKKFIAALLYMLIALGGVVVDIIVPSLPSIQSSFATSETNSQWVFSAAVLGFGLGQMLAGFIVDAYGRKRPMLLGGLLLSFAMFASVTAANIEFLIVFRLIEGLAVSFVAVGGRAAIKDIYQGADYLKAVNWITISFALGITLSPFVGGYIEQHFGWEMVFVFLGVWTLLGTMLMQLTFTETHIQHHPLKRESIKNSLQEILLNRSFQRVALTCGIFYSILPTFNTVAPFLIQNTMGYSPVFYGRIALLLGGCWLAGNVFNRMTFSVSLSRKTSISIILSIIAILMAILWQVFHGLSILALVLPVSIVIFSLGMLFPPFLGKALAPFDHIAGIANALVFSGCWLTTALVSFFASSLSSESALPLLALYVLLMLTIVLVNRRTWD
ncbi:MFS transporter [Vibrio sp. SCSIO 43140]|uniref:MFS transporter n=1 Tax=Vibrio sp. SCSIO 43140 TaxID=2819100 RepID=UPI0020763D7E|nr:MFS transporter [Vibrio sp. SCSIO 43140]USD61334.1 MFS transporter [Vibrio sp. SCSIO 43140]